MKGLMLAGLLAVQVGAHPGHDNHGDAHHFHFHGDDGHHFHEEDHHDDHHDAPGFGRASPPHPPSLMTLEARVGGSDMATEPFSMDSSMGREPFLNPMDSSMGHRGRGPAVWPGIGKPEPAIWSGEVPAAWSSEQPMEPVAPRPVALWELHQEFHAAIKAAQEACGDELATFCADPADWYFSSDFAMSSDPSFTVTTDVSSGVVSIAAPQGMYSYADSEEPWQVGGSFVDTAAPPKSTVDSSQYYTVVDSSVESSGMAVDPMPADLSWVNFDRTAEAEILDSSTEISAKPFRLPDGTFQALQVLRAETASSPPIWTAVSSSAEPESSSSVDSLSFSTSAVWVSVVTPRDSYTATTSSRFGSSESVSSAPGFAGTPTGRMAGGCTHGVRGGGFAFAIGGGGYGGYSGGSARGNSPMPLGFGSREADACMMAHLAQASDQCQAAVVTAVVAGAQLHDAQEIADEMWSRSAGAAALNVLAAGVIALFAASIVAAKRRRKILLEVESWWAAVHRNPDVRGAVERKVGEEVPEPSRLARPLFCVVLGTLINGAVLLAFVVMPLLMAADRLARGGPNGDERQAMIAENMSYDEDMDDMDDLFECPMVPLLLVGLTIAAFISVKRRHRLAKKIFKMWRVIHADEVLRAAVEAEADKPMPPPPQRMPGRCCMFKVAMRLVRLAVVLAGFTVFVTLGHALLGGGHGYHHHDDGHHGHHGHHHSSGEYPPSSHSLAATALWWGLLSLVFAAVYRAVRRNNRAAARNNGPATPRATAVATASAVTGTGTQTPPGDDNNSSAAPDAARTSTVVVVGTPVNPPPSAGGYVPPVVPATQVETAIV